MAGIASLIEAERPRLAQMLGAGPLDIVEVDKDHIRVASHRVTIHFHRRQEDGVVHSSLELPSVPAHRVPLTSHVHCWLILRSRGEAWPEPVGEQPIGAQIGQELERLERALAVVKDETAFIECLLWEAGYMDGYSSWH